MEAYNFELTGLNQINTCRGYYNLMNKNTNTKYILYQTIQSIEDSLEYIDLNVTEVELKTRVKYEINGSLETYKDSYFCYTKEKYDPIINSHEVDYNYNYVTQIYEYLKHHDILELYYTSDKFIIFPNINFFFPKKGDLDVYKTEYKSYNIKQKYDYVNKFGFMLMMKGVNGFETMNILKEKNVDVLEESKKTIGEYYKNIFGLNPDTNLLKIHVSRYSNYRYYMVKFNTMNRYLADNYISYIESQQWISIEKAMLLIKSGEIEFVQKILASDKDNAKKNCEDDYEYVIHSAMKKVGQYGNGFDIINKYHQIPNAFTYSNQNCVNSLLIKKDGELYEYSLESMPFEINSKLLIKLINDTLHNKTKRQHIIKIDKYKNISDILFVALYIPIKYKVSIRKVPINDKIYAIKFRGIETGVEYKNRFNKMMEFIKKTNKTKLDPTLIIYLIYINLVFIKLNRGLTKDEEYILMRYTDDFYTSVHNLFDKTSPIYFSDNGDYVIFKHLDNISNFYLMYQNIKITIKKDKAKEYGKVFDIINKIVEKNKKVKKDILTEINTDTVNDELYAILSKCTNIIEVYSDPKKTIYNMRHLNATSKKEIKNFIKKFVIYNYMNKTEIIKEDNDNYGSVRNFNDFDHNNLNKYIQRDFDLSYIKKYLRQHPTIISAHYITDNETNIFHLHIYIKDELTDNFRSSTKIINRNINDGSDSMFMLTYILQNGDLLESDIPVQNTLPNNLLDLKIDEQNINNYYKLPSQKQEYELYKKNEYINSLMKI